MQVKEWERERSVPINSSRLLADAFGISCQTNLDQIRRFRWRGRKLGDFGNLGNLEELFFRTFSIPSFPFFTIPKTENSEMKTSEFFLRHFDQMSRFSKSEFSILHVTENGKLGDENLKVFSKAV